MKIKPRTWVFAGDFCCREFKSRVKYDPSSSISTDGEKVFFDGTKIINCPYCGTKIVLEKEVM